MIQGDEKCMMVRVLAEMGDMNFASRVHKFTGRLYNLLVGIHKLLARIYKLLARIHN